MMKKMILLLLISSLSNAGIVVKDYEKKIKNTYSIKTIVDKVSKNELEDSLRTFIASGRPSRLVGTKGHDAAYDFILRNLKELNSKDTSLETQEFTPDILSASQMYQDDFNREVVAKLPPSDPNYRRWKTFTLSMLKALSEVKMVKGKNIIWEKKGNVNPNEVLIIGANYDTLNHDQKTMKVDLKSSMPGADNNATGVATLLNIAKILNALDLPKTVRIVFFDFEEFGFLGSKAYVEKLGQNTNEKVLGYINLVMLGNDTKIKDSEKKFNNYKVYLRNPSSQKEEAEKDLALLNPLNKMGKNMYPMIDFVPEANGMNSSSHIRFWEKGYPAVTFTQNWESDFNPRFHTPDDFVETINFQTFNNSFRFISSGVVAFLFAIVK